MIPAQPESTTAHEQVRHIWRWRVLPSLHRRDPDALLAALVVADTSLDAILIAAGYNGTTVGERLQHASRSFSDYTGIRAARHIRHQAVHQLDYRLCWHAAHAALQVYARALWEQGVDLEGIWYQEEDTVDGAPEPMLLFPHTQLCGKGMLGERADAGRDHKCLAPAGAAQ